MIDPKNLKALADKYIPGPKKIERLHEQYVTTDIINEVLSQFERCKNQLQQFAKFLRGNDIKSTCFNIWAFWRHNIRYQADNAGALKQIVKSPAAVWADKFCDCKSFSVAVMCCLYQLDIKAVFRFVSYNPDAKDIPTHVYVVANVDGKEVVIDCCLPEFNKEKMYSEKYDYLSPGLYAVTGVPGKHRHGIKKDVKKGKQRGSLNLQHAETEAELALMLHEQKLELEQDVAAKMYGIGSVADNAYELELAAVNNALYEIANPRLKATRNFRSLVPAKETEFIGKPKDRAVKKEKKKTDKAVKKNAAGKAVNKKDAKRLEKINVTVKKKKEGLLKKVAKVVTAPLRLIAKGAIEMFLPKSAPVFLYLFITDQKVLSKAPAVVIAKRARAQKIADKITGKIGMKQDHFMQILRNGILSNLGDTPENVIAKWMKDANFQIGFAIAALSVAAKFLGQLAMKVGAGNLEELQNSAPDPSDWVTESSEVRNDLAQTVTNQPTNNDVVNNGSVPVYTESQNYQQANGSGFNYTSNQEGGIIPEEVENKYGTAGKMLQNVTLPSGKANTTANGEDLTDTAAPVTAGEDQNAVDEGTNNNSGLLMVGLGLAAVLMMSHKSSR